MDMIVQQRSTILRSPGGLEFVYLLLLIVVVFLIFRMLKDLNIIE